MTTTTLITDDQELVGAKSEFDNPIRVYDDGWGKLWVYRTSLGVTGIVRAQTWHDAYECVLDEILTPISVDDVSDAYGAWDKLRDFLINKGHEDTPQLRHFCSRYDTLYFDIATHNANETAAWDDWPLIEGYEYQSNGKGTGIVSIDLNWESLELLTLEFIDRAGISLEIKDEDD